jgi:hypothetical protein
MGRNRRSRPALAQKLNDRSPRGRGRPGRSCDGCSSREWLSALCEAAGELPPGRKVLGRAGGRLLKHHPGVQFPEILCAKANANENSSANRRARGFRCDLGRHRKSRAMSPRRSAKAASHQGRARPCRLAVAAPTWISRLPSSLVMASNLRGGGRESSLECIVVAPHGRGVEH